ncbi:hypothetical protein T484DRAFT_2598068 [Baffinella frigidus]|nr:hypothetical protein T484DRAFT_2598068 [Cryptophyta sp. CCMP2293]
MNSPYALIYTKIVFLRNTRRDEIAARQTPEISGPGRVPQPSPNPLPTLSQPSPNPLPTLSQPSPNPLATLSQPSPNPLQTLSQPSPNPLPTLSQPSPNPLPTLSQPSPNPVHGALLSQRAVLHRPGHPCIHHTLQHPVYFRLPPITSRPSTPTRWTTDLPLKVNLHCGQLT